MISRLYIFFKNIFDVLKKKGYVNIKPKNEKALLNFLNAVFLEYYVFSKLFEMKFEKKYIYTHILMKIYPNKYTLSFTQEIVHRKEDY